MAVPSTIQAQVIAPVGYSRAPCNVHVQKDAESIGDEQLYGDKRLRADPHPPKPEQSAAAATHPHMLAPPAWPIPAGEQPRPVAHHRPALCRDTLFVATVLQDRTLLGKWHVAQGIVNYFEVPGEGKGQA